MNDQKDTPWAVGQTADGAQVSTSLVKDSTVSVITASKPKRLAKAFHLKDGELHKEAGGSLVRGHYERKAVASPDEFAELLASLQPDQALCYGVATQDSGTVASRKAQQDGEITRTRDYFDWPAGPAWLMLDYDPAQGTEPLSMPELHETLRKVWPDIEHAPAVMASSGSAFIYNRETGECLKGAGGIRCCILVADGRDIPRAGDALFKRLWLSGYGFNAVSKSGALLERTLVDGSVWQPERLDFAAGAACVPPLEQQRPDPLVLNGEAAPIDTAMSLPDLTADEQQRLAEIKAEAREAVKGEQEQVREEWVEERLATVADTLTGEEVEQVKQRLHQAVTDGQLFGDFELLDSSGRKVTVGDVLDKANDWHGERFADPLEPDYGNDARIAWANLRSGGKPYIYSHAHGGQRFRLVRASTTINVAAGELPRLVEEAGDLMRHAGEVYQRGGQLVRIADGGIFHVTGPWLRTHLERIAHFQKFDARSKKWKPSDCPSDLHARILHNRGDWAVPELRGVVRGPLMRPDGSLLMQPGYDHATGVLLLADHPDGWPSVPEKPTHDQVRSAVSRLWEPFAHFPFVAPLSRAIHIAACLTSVQRIMLPTAPAFAYNSYKAGSGKGKAAKAVGWLGGHEPVESPWSTEAEEQRKRLMAKLLQAPPSLLIDNVNGALDSDTLCAILTSTTYEDRRLGVSEDVSVPTRLLVMATGNHIRVVGDLARRVLVPTIDHGVESPERLAFPFDPVARVKDRWTYYRAAALTILRGFHAAGRPKHGRGQMGSFEEWDALVRQCVVWLQREELAPFELADPADAVSDNYEGDPETQKLRALVDSWESVFGQQPIRVGELVDRAQHLGIGAPPHRANLMDALQEIAGEPDKVNRRRLGRWIEGKAGRVVDGRRIEPAGERSHTRLWTIKHVQ